MVFGSVLTAAELEFSRTSSPSNVSILDFFIVNTFSTWCSLKHVMKRGLSFPPIWVPPVNQGLKFPHFQTLNFILCKWFDLSFYKQSPLHDHPLFMFFPNSPLLEKTLNTFLWTIVLYVTSGWDLIWINNKHHKWKTCWVKSINATKYIH